MSYNLFLDDIRIPPMAYGIVPFEGYRTLSWIIVRDYEEFVKCISDRGLPEIVSFDHDLADEHYTQSAVYTERTGDSCARWLVEYCVLHGYGLPDWYVHSMNPIGRENIKSTLQSFERYQKIMESQGWSCSICQGPDYVDHGEKKRHRTCQQCGAPHEI